MSDVVPCVLPAITASIIYPACDILLYAMKRFMLSCRMANMLATVMVNTITMLSIRAQRSAIGAKTFVRILMSAKAAAPFDMTDR